MTDAPPAAQEQQEQLLQRPLLPPPRASPSALARSPSSSEAGTLYRRYRGRGYVPPPREQSWQQAAFILVAELVGTGVLALPHTFAVVGLGAGLALLITFALLSLYSGLLLYRLQRWFPQGITYGDMAFEVAGTWGQAVVFGFIYIAFFGNLAIYILTCSEALQNVFFDQHWCKWAMALATCAFLLPFCQLRTLHQVSYVASASGASIFMALAIVLAVTLSHGATHPDLAAATTVAEAPEEDVHSFLKSMSVITTAIFAFGGQGLYFETMAEMRNPDDFPKAVTLTTGLILAVYLLVSVVCLHVYGDAVRPNILFALPRGTPKRVASALMFFHVCISYVLAQQVIGRAILVRVLHHDDVDSGSRRERRYWFAISLAMLTLSFLIANGVPFFQHLMGFVAALSTAPLTFGIPALMIWHGKRSLDKLRADPSRTKVFPSEYPLLAMLVLLSLYLIVVGVLSNASELARKWNSIGKPFACHA